MNYDNQNFFQEDVLEIAHKGKSLIFIFQEFSSSSSKAFILAGGLGLGYHSMKLRQFPDIS